MCCKHTFKCFCFFAVVFIDQHQRRRLYFDTFITCVPAVLCKSEMNVKRPKISPLNLYIFFYHLNVLQMKYLYISHMFLNIVFNKCHDNRVWLLDSVKAHLYLCGNF